MSRADEDRRQRELRVREREAAMREREAEARAARIASIPGADSYARGAPVAGRRSTARRGGWRDEVIGVSGLTILAAVWLIISPFALDYTAGDAVWNPIVFGAILGSIAAARMAGAYRQTRLSWISAGIGGWLFVSGFWLADSGEAQWNSWIMGAIVFALALWSATAGEGPARRERRANPRS